MTPRESGPPTNAANRFTIGVDVGGTGIKALLVDAGTRVAAERRVPTPRPGPRIAERVVDAVYMCVVDLERNAPERPAAIGLAVPGIIDDASGVAVFAENLGWRDVPLRDMLAHRVRVPIAFGHDVRAGGLAEMRIGAGAGAGAGAGYQSALFIAIGTGISAALYLDGRPYTGRGFAGELGHTDVGHTEPCVCGAVGCLEAIASAAAIARRYTARGGRPVTGASGVLTRVREGDPIAAGVWTEALDALGLALSWSASVLAPDAVILGGGLAAAGPDLFDPLTERIAARLTFQRSPRLLPAALGDRAAALGSALMARSVLAGELEQT